ncbi:MAG: Cell division protein FtsH (EC [uncultured Thiotrichaceae bacterium]|uniref:ATP-dependent zinc metalloprotease FtsH n=1 Tax=uncultured Thiotrichaceae bacterium TaxID=298394 RepID=A0A6S6TLW8_9GAMM|nr:MAG: Cell division protein FtsH (EC [uncultured Thiotrichaceae bacterium]
MNDLTKNILIWLGIALMLILVFQKFQPPGQPSRPLNYTQFIKEVKRGNIESVDIQNQTIIAKTKSGEKYSTYMPANDPKLIDDLLANDVEVTAAAPAERSLLWDIIISWAPFLLIIGLWIYIMRQMQGGGGRGGPMSFGKSKARMMTEDQVKVSFADVAGCEEAKGDVQEIVDFLRDPSKFQKLGGKIPRGVLMVGSPGTGKTLLAKAIAGEAKVPFFSISGSDFVEMFVGVGASRVRDMFEQAKKHAPCIIFIDEIDAVGRQRGAGVGGGNDEREQTLNQLLVEMDGFEGNEGVIVIAATNRPDVLDQALLRPGRFDRQVVVPLPDVRGREQILKVHMRKVPLGDDVKPSLLARGTPGFSGADLANLVNEAALFSARSDKRVVGMAEFEQAKDKIMMGAERKSMVMGEDEKKLTAYHEAGHAIVGLKVPDHDPVYKVSIIPRGRALGVTMFLPEEDRYSHSKQHLESQLSSLFGGRIAEEMIFGPAFVTTGASNDIERASDIARNMVTKWGLSDRMGPLAYSQDQENYLGQAGTQHKPMSDDTALAIDEEIRDFIDRNYKRSEDILKENIDVLHAMSAALMKYETIDHVQIKALMNGDEPPPPQDWIEKDDDNDDSSGTTTTLDSAKDEDAADDSLDGTASLH